MMKRKIICLVLAFAVVFSLSSACFAYEEDETYTNAQLNFVTDEVGILSEEQRRDLENYAYNLSFNYACGVYIIIVDDYTQYSGGENGIFSFATTVFDEFTLGYGSDQNGVLLVLSMSDRDYALISHGYFGNAAFTDYGKDILSEAFLDDFSHNDWFTGFSDYVLTAERMLELAEAGTPVDVGSMDRAGQKDGISFASVLLIIVIAGIVAAIVTLSMKSKMKTAVARTNANIYIPVGGASLVGQYDNYTHTTTTRVPIQTNTSSRGGTTVRSSGFSGKSGKF